MIYGFDFCQRFWFRGCYFQAYHNKFYLFQISFGIKFVNIHTCTCPNLQARSKADSPFLFVDQELQPLSRSNSVCKKYTYFRLSNESLQKKFVSIKVTSFPTQAKILMSIMQKATVFKMDKFMHQTVLNRFYSKPLCLLPAINKPSSSIILTVSVLHHLQNAFQNNIVQMLMQSLFPQPRINLAKQMPHLTPHFNCRCL